MDLWLTLADRAGVPLPPATVAQLSRYLDLLMAANATMNLTRLPDRASAELLHIADALTLLPHLAPGAGSVADVGSGGGVPGLPIAIARPDLAVTLIESTRKKAAFLTATAEALGLTNVTVLSDRAEEIAKAGAPRRATYDVVLARAVATTDWLAEWCLPLAKRGGRVLLMKGPRVHDELPLAEKAIRSCGGAAPTVYPVDLPGTTGHVIVEIPKPNATDPRYPRDPTLAKGNPIR